MVSPTRHTILQGEVTLLRLLSHLGPAHLSFESLPAEHATASDWMLDMIYQLAQGSVSKQKLTAFVDKHAPRQNTWLLGHSSPTILDGALWSYFKSRGALECPTKMKNWMNDCNNMFLK
jgi:hypothetical protein